jgi:hypothetical protein
MVVGLLLGLAAPERWGEAAAGGTPTRLTAADMTPPEKVLWEGLAIPPKEAQRRVVIEATRQLEAEQREVQGRETARREPKGLAAEPSDAQQREVLKFLAWGIDEMGHQTGFDSTFMTTTSAQARPLAPEVFPAVTIGVPVVSRLPDPYPLEQLPLPMQAQLRAADFYLIRLFCSFRPAPRSRVGWARFHVFLQPDHLGRQPIAYDIAPLDVTQEIKGHLKFTLAPTLKFQLMEAGVGSLEFGLDYPELQPIIVGAGIGEAIPTWDYKTATGMASIQGAKKMHLLVKAPKGMPVVRAELVLTAQLYVESITSWIPIVGGPVERGARLDAPLWPVPGPP